MEKLDEKAMATAGALTMAILHALMGLVFWGAPQPAMGAYRMMMYTGGQYGAFDVTATTFVAGIIGALVIGAIVGFLVAVFYNWALRK